MPFSEKLTILMQKRGITAQQISKESNSVVKVSDIRRFQNESGCPTSYQMTWLSKILGIDMELFLYKTPERISPKSQLGISISDFVQTKAIKKPGVKVKTSKIKNSITRVHKIPRPDVLVCSNCDDEDESCNYAHPEDLTFKFLFGGHCTGEKTPDEIVSLLCYECRSSMDMKPNKDHYTFNLEHSLRWGKAIVKTMAIRLALAENKK